MRMAHAPKISRYNVVTNSQNILYYGGHVSIGEKESDGGYAPPAKKIHLLPT